MISSLSSRLSFYACSVSSSATFPLKEIWLVEARARKFLTDKRLSSIIHAVIDLRIYLMVTVRIDCSQSPIFPLDRRCRSLSPTGRHLGLLMRAKLGRGQNARGSPWTHRHFVLSPVSLTSRDQDGGASDSTTISRKNRGLWTVYRENLGQTFL